MKKLIALLLVMAMALSMLSIPAVAAELSENTTVVTEEMTPPDSSEEAPVEEPPAEEPTPEPPQPETPAEDSSEAPAPETPAEEEIPAGEETSSGEPEESGSTEEELPAEDAEEISEEDETITDDVEDDSAELLNAAYTVNETTHSITVNPTSHNDVSPNLGSAIKFAGTHATAKEIWKVKVPAGSYDQSAPTRLYPNVTLDLTGVTLHFTGSGNMFFTRTSTGGYNDNINITILGGTLYGKEGSAPSTMHIAHGKNVVLNGTTFAYSTGGHQLEVAGINGLTVKNCTFKDLTPCAARSGGCEPLQMDILATTDVYNDAVYDGTPMKNVRVTGCTFANCRRGIGVHSQLLGSYHSGLEISNCTFTNLTDTAIFLIAFRNVVIKDNTMTKVGQGVYMSMIRSGGTFVYTTLNGSKDYSTGKTIQKDSSTQIHNNKISVIKRSHCASPTGIWLYGEKFATPKKDNADTVPAGTYSISNVSITSNNITVHGDGVASDKYAFGVRLTQAEDCVVSGNTVTYAGPTTVNGYGITAGTTSKRTVITNNTVSKFPRYNIRLNGNSQATSINSNKLSGSGGHALHLYGGAAAASISSNTITSSGDDGIHITAMKSKCSINKNTVSGCAVNPIYVSNDPAFTTTLNTNILTAKSGKDNMKIAKGTIAASGNTFTGGSSAISTASGVKGSISHNTMKTTGLKYNINGTRTGNTATTTITSASKSSTGVLKVKWSRTSSAAGYMIQYSTHSDMSSPKTVSVSGGSTVSKTISKLTKGKRYYARVRAYRTVNGIKVYGKYSSIKSAVV